MNYGKFRKSPEQLQKEFDKVKREVVKQVAQGYRGTIIDWTEKLKNLGYADELNVGCALAELAYERKVSLLATKHIPDGAEAGTGLIIMGIYGPPRNKS